VSVAAKAYELVAYGAVEVAIGGRVDELGRTELFDCLLGLVEDRRWNDAGGPDGCKSLGS